MKQIRRYYKGEVDGWMIATIGLIIAVLAAGSLAIWGWLNYQEQKTNVDGKVDTAVAEARRDQAAKDQENFLKEEKNPNRDFAAPDDFGRLSFKYPKTWSVYVDKDPVAEGRTGGDYMAYLNPVVVPPVSMREQRFATRVSILNKNYNDHLESYDRLVEDGKLRSSTVSINGENAVRFDGNFDDKIRGSAVVFKIRDKTAVVQTDADTFQSDFDALIQTITFVK